MLEPRNSVPSLQCHKLVTVCLEGHIDFFSVVVISHANCFINFFVEEVYFGLWFCRVRVHKASAGALAGAGTEYSHGEPQTQSRKS